MAVNRKDLMDTFVAWYFGYALIFGLISHVYDARKDQRVHSPEALIYSRSLHIASVLLFPVYYKNYEVDEYYTQSKRYFLSQLFVLLRTIEFGMIFVSICRHWVSRENTLRLANELIRIWRKDMANLRWSDTRKRQTVKWCIFKSLLSVMVGGAILLSEVAYAHGMVPILCSIYETVLLNVIVAVMFQFTCGVIFIEYLFRILDDNLSRVVEDIGGVSGSRTRKTLALREELMRIGRIHAHLQAWVVQFKNMFQVELLLIVFSFFLSQVFTLFYIYVLMHEEWTHRSLVDFLTAGTTACLCALDLVTLFYFCGQLLDACHEAGHILKDLSGKEFCCVELERCVEMLCFQMKCDKLRLGICGCLDLDWSYTFTLTEAAFLYVIILIQWDYDNI